MAIPTTRAKNGNASNRSRNKRCGRMGELDTATILYLWPGRKSPLTPSLPVCIHMNSTRSLTTQSAFRILPTHIETSAPGARLQQWPPFALVAPWRLGARQSQPAFCPISRFKTGQHPPRKSAVLFEGVTRERQEITTYDDQLIWVLNHDMGQNGGPAVLLTLRFLPVFPALSRLFPISRIFRNLPRTSEPNKMS